MNVSKPMASWTSYKAQLELLHSSILNEVASGQKQINGDLRDTGNTHEVTKAIEWGNKISMFSFSFKKVRK